MPNGQRCYRRRALTTKFRRGWGGGRSRNYEVVGLTDQTLSCAARARVATAARHAACLHLKRAMRAACRRPSCAEQGGSAAGPEPGRASFYGELGGRRTPPAIKIYLRPPRSDSSTLKSFIQSSCSTSFAYRQITITASVSSVDHCEANSLVRVLLMRLSGEVETLLN